MKVVCIGSSNTVGFPLKKGQGWVSLWEKASGYEIINKGVIGSSAEGMLFRFKTDVLDLAPDMAVIVCGTVDFITYDKTPEEVMGYLLRMVTMCKEKGIKPVVIAQILIDMPLACKVMAGDACIDYVAINERLIKLRDLMISAADKNGFEVWDFQKGFDKAIKGKDRALYFVDGIHPNAKTNKIFAGLVKEYSS